MTHSRLRQQAKRLLLGTLSCALAVPLTCAAAPTLDPNQLLQLAVVHNVDAAYSRLQARVAEEGFQAETGLYRASLYGTSRIEGRHLQRSIEQQLAALYGQVTTLDERVRVAETGVRGRTPTGAEYSLGLKASQKINNVIAKATASLSDRETTSALVLTVRQPLLRGGGRDVVETDLRVADKERQIASWQYRQQLMRVASDALSAFWQLQRAYETQAIRTEALANAQAVLADVRARVAAGRLAPSSVVETEATVANRAADLSRGAQAVVDGEARLRTLLDLPPDDTGWQLQPPSDEGERAVANSVEFEAALQAWPAWRMSQLRREQAQLRLAFAKDRQRPGLDLLASYSTNGLNYGPTTAARQAVRGGHPDWYVGVSLDAPFGGDPRADAQYRAQLLKLEQAELEGSSVRLSLSNDLQSRSSQLAAALQELKQARAEIEARQETLLAEQEQFNAGIAPLNRLLRREADLLEARLRLVDTRSRMELTRVALQLAQGTLLSAHDVRIEE